MDPYRRPIQNRGEKLRAPTPKWQVWLLIVFVLAGYIILLRSCLGRDASNLFAVFGLEDGEPVPQFTNAQQLIEDAAEQQALALSGDGKRFAAAGRDGVIRVWDNDAGRWTIEWAAHAKGVSALAFSPDGLMLASSGRGERVMRIWDVNRGELIAELEPALTVGTVDHLVYSPDGKLILFTGENEQYRFVLLWEVAAGSQTGRLAGHQDLISVMRFSPDGALLATGGYDQAIYLWDWDSRTSQMVLSSPAPVLDVAFSPDGALLASAHNDSSVILWNVQTGKVMGVLRGHDFSVRAVAYSPDGALLASGDGEKIQLWDPATETLLAQLYADSRTVRGVAFKPDGQSMVSISGMNGKGGVFLWNLSTLEWE